MRFCPLIVAFDFGDMGEALKLDVDLYISLDTLSAGLLEEERQCMNCTAPVALSNAATLSVLHSLELLLFIAGFDSCDVLICVGLFR